MTTIIIDDEPQSHRALKELLSRDHPNIAVLGSGYSIKEGLELILKHRPELVFLDIELPDGLGFDLLDKIEEPDFHVIFITAHDHYARTAIKFGALDYLLKPVPEDDLREAIKRARKKHKEKVSHQQLQILFEALKNLDEQKLPSRLGISTIEGIIYRQVDEIIRMEAQQNYTEFILASDKKKILASIHLKEYEDQFGPYQEFMRVHRSHLVNLSFVDRYVRSDGGYLVLRDETAIPVSRRYRDELLERLDRL